MKTLSIAGLLLGGVLAGQPSAHAGDTRAIGEDSTMSDLMGTWVYATDPAGQIPEQAIYAGSTITFGAGERYSFQLASTKVALEGSFKVATWSAAGGVVDTNYGEGRTNQLHLELRLDSAGKVAGFVVREGAKAINPRYYLRKTN